ncbi:MAG TPA: VCBS repeat-containing protein [Oligoflexia bacterium]|nr:VCBS repeat-containing protein [Oligoflexia bacterium]
MIFLNVFFTLGGFLVHAQSFMPQERPLFNQFSYPIKERIRAIDVVVGQKKSNILLLTRQGEYPNWDYSLRLLGFEQKQWQVKYQYKLGAKVLYYSSLNLPNNEQAIVLWDDQGIVMHRTQQGSWQNYQILQWQNELQKPTLFNRNNEPAYVSVLKDPKSPNNISLFMNQSLHRFTINADTIKHELNYQPKLPLYVSSSRHSLPLEFKFAAKQSVYYPNVAKGKYKGNDALFFSWVDQVDIFSWQTAKHLKHFNFNQLSENERDSGQAMSSVNMLDLNGDEHMDYVLNISLGSPTQMRSRSSVHYGQANGEVNMKGVKFNANADRASGLIAYDLNKDKHYEFVSASGQFNVWSILKALTKRQVDITFSTYEGQKKMQQFGPAIAQKKLTFGFNLNDLNLEGILPNIEHDFNADGLNDVFYAQNNRKLSVILQKKDKEMYFENQVVGDYEVNIPKYHRLGDFNGDQKTDIVLFSTKPKENKAITTLINNL